MARLRARPSRRGSGLPGPAPPPCAPAPRGPTCGGRGGALVALVKLEEEIKVELLVLLQPRHVGSGVRDQRVGVRGQGSGVRGRGRRSGVGSDPGFGSGRGSGTWLGSRVGVRGRDLGWSRAGSGVRSQGLGRGPGLESGWGPGSGSGCQVGVGVGVRGLEGVRSGSRVGAPAAGTCGRGARGSAAPCARPRVLG